MRGPAPSPHGIAGAVPTRPRHEAAGAVSTRRARRGSCRRPWRSGPAPTSTRMLPPCAWPCWRSVSSVFGTDDGAANTMLQARFARFQRKSERASDRRGRGLRANALQGQDHETRARAAAAAEEREGACLVAELKRAKARVEVARAARGAERAKRTGACGSFAPSSMRASGHLRGDKTAAGAAAATLHRPEAGPGAGLVPACNAGGSAAAMRFWRRRGGGARM